MCAGVLLAALVVAGQNADVSASRELHRLFEEAWQWELAENPTWASYLGDLRYNDRWPDRSLKAIERRARKRAEFLDRLHRIDPRTLRSEDRISYRMFERWQQDELKLYEFGWYVLPLNHREGIQSADVLADALPFETEKHYRDWLQRLADFPAYMDQTIRLLELGIERGMVHSKPVAQRIPDQIRKQIVDDPEKSPFFKPFVRMPTDLPEELREELRATARQLIRTRVVPAYRRLLSFFETRYLPAAPERVGIWQFPRGKELYRFLARMYTTTDLTPEEIHAMGQHEVRRIRAEMERVIGQTGFKGTFREFLEFLRTDRRFYVDDPEELLRIYRATCKRIDPGLVRLFRRLPRMPYGVEPIPAHVAPDTTTAYYRPPAADGSRAGTYFVNLYRPETRPLYEVEVLSVHEAVPGHHLQIALAMELEGLPAFRRYRGVTAFVEGWALYSESLGEELGLYDDPYSKFGQLTYEMWRAVRLVVDTGMHYFGWTRQRAIDFFLENTAKSKLDVVNEVDRYIAWPGQALAYKVGELKIKELRSEAERMLGDRFDLREFHDVVLSSGAIPLDVLESKVRRWMIRKRGQQ